MNSLNNSEIICNHVFSEFHEIKFAPETIVLHGKTVTLDHFYQRVCSKCGQIHVETDIKRISLPNEQSTGRSRHLVQGNSKSVDK